MYTLLLTLHVLLAIFLIGPLATVPHIALRGIRRREAATVHSGSRQTTIFGLGSILVFLLGFGVVSTKSERFSITDPWIVISITLYVVALLLTLLVLVPDLRRAGKLIEHGVLDAAAAKKAVDAKSATEGEEEGAEPAEPTLTATAADLAATQRLDALRGRATALAGLVTLLYAVIVVMMVVRPFG